MSLYPLLFEPTFHYRIWGGSKLKKFGKNITEENIGESWEISTVPGFVSKVSNGELKGKNLNELVAEYKEKITGGKVYQQYGEEFPLLIKFLDADAPLSVQVHPDDKYARKYHNSFGKTEMWYVLDSEKDSEIIVGFEEGVDQETFSRSEENGTLESILRKIHPEKGDVVYIPAGRVHAMGKGIMVAEIQQTSDVTYRIYDYNRVDKDGKTRELHTRQAKEVSDFSFIDQPLVKYDKNARDTNLVTSPYFTTSRLIFSGTRELPDSPDSFRILICLKGNGVIESEVAPVSFTQGQSILIPAALKQVKLKSQNKEEITLLEVHI